MEQVVILGESQNDKLLPCLKQFLSRYAEACWFDGTAFHFSEKPAEVFFHYVQELERLEGGKSILLLLKKANLKKARYLSEKTTVVIDSENRKQLEQIRRFPVNVVTFGLSAKDTVTFSSREEQSAVVSLQRSVTALDGAVLDPMEIPCILKGNCSDQLILGIVAILILLHLIDSEKEETLYFPASF